MEATDANIAPLPNKLPQAQEISSKALRSFEEAGSFFRDMKDRIAFQRLNQARYPGTPNNALIKLIYHSLFYAQELPDLQKESWNTTDDTVRTLGTIIQTTTSETPIIDSQGQQFGKVRFISGHETSDESLPHINFGDVPLPDRLETTLRFNEKDLTIDLQGKEVTISYTQKNGGREFSLVGEGLNVIITEEGPQGPIIAGPGNS